MALSYAFDAQRDTPQALARRRENADLLTAQIFSRAPKNVGEGLNMIGQALMLRGMNNEIDAAQTAGMGSIPGWLNGGGGNAPIPSMGAAAPSQAVPSTSAPMGQTSIPGGNQEFVASLMPHAQEASAQTGIDPRIIIGQAAVESAWGKSAPGNNLFGIKSHGQPGGNVLPTTEVVNGQPVRTSDSFRAYASPAESVAGYTNFINSNPRYASLKSAQGMDAQLSALQASGYATDPNYSAKVGQIARNLPETQGPVLAQRQTSPATAQPQTASSGSGSHLAGRSTEELTQAMINPWAAPYRPAIEMELKYRQENSKPTHLDLGDRVAFTDRSGNVIREIAKGEPAKAPSFGVIGQDQFGNNQYGWQDQKTKQITPYTPPATGLVGQSEIPPVPPGVDPKVWREAHSKRATEDAMPASSVDTSKLRNEVQGLPSYKNLAQAAPVYRSMYDAAGRDTRAADLNMIYGMGKIMDPGSVVREGEMGLAQSIATLPQQLRATVESQLSGNGRLSPDVRAAIMQEARSRVQSYQGMFDQDANMYRGIARDNRMNVDHVLPNFGTFDEYRPAKPMTPQQPVTIDGYNIRAR